MQFRDVLMAAATSGGGALPPGGTYNITLEDSSGIIQTEDAFSFLLESAP